MSTQTIVIGQPCTTKKLVPIEFNSLLRDTIEICHVDDDLPTDYKFIELICKNYGSNMDLMFAYNDPQRRDQGVLILGRWNDGVVE